MYKTKTERGPTMRELPEGERPREKLLERGAAFLSNTELLAILIGSGTREESAMELAARIISFSGSLSELAGLRAEELSFVKGIGAAKACTLVAAIELGKRISCSAPRSREKLSGPREAAELFMEEMRYLKKEHFRAALLSVKNEVMSIENVSVGGISASPAHPREVFSPAILKGANSVILAHNHPSGDPEPSPADESLTRRLCEAGRTLGINVLDHIIIGDGRYTSMKEKGFIP